MIVDNRKKTQRKPDLKISENLKLKQQDSSKIGITDKASGESCEQLRKNTDKQLAEYYVQLFLLS